MDIWGIAIFVVCGVIYLAARKQSKGWSELMIFGMGIGVGLIIGAIYALQVINSIFG